MLGIYSTARVYVNCADEFHALWRRVVRRVYTFFLRTRSKKKFAIHVSLLFSAISFFCISLLYETKDFKVWKSGEKTTENLHNEKKLSCYTRASRVASRIFRITSSSSRFAWFELLMNQLGKENVTCLRHRNTSFIEQVTKQIWGDASGLKCKYFLEMLGYYPSIRNIPSCARVSKPVRISQKCP